MITKSALVLLAALVAVVAVAPAASAQSANVASFSQNTPGDSSGRSDGSSLPDVRACYRQPGTAFNPSRVVRCEPTPDETGGFDNACFCHVTKVVDAKGRKTNRLDCDRLVTVGIKQTRVLADNCDDIRRLPKVAIR